MATTKRSSTPRRAQAAKAATRAGDGVREDEVAGLAAIGVAGLASAAEDIEMAGELTDIAASRPRPAPLTVVSI
jgi:hypothetical protein